MTTPKIDHIKDFAATLKLMTELEEEGHDPDCTCSRCYDGGWLAYEDYIEAQCSGN